MILWKNLMTKMRKKGNFAWLSSLTCVTLRNNSMCISRQKLTMLILIRSVRTPLAVESIVHVLFYIIIVFSCGLHAKIDVLQHDDVIQFWRREFLHAYAFHLNWIELRTSRQDIEVLSKADLFRLSNLNDYLLSREVKKG